MANVYKIGSNIIRLAGGGGSVFGTPSGTFPLSISGRHLQTASGSPFLLIGDALWSLEVQASLAQITTILTNRAAKGYTCFVMEAFERLYSDSTPPWANVNGNIPFTTTNNSGSMTWTAHTEAYWVFLDHIVNTAKALGMAVIINPAYAGYAGTASTDGWMTAMNAASDADLQSHGVFLANRYTQGNVIWCEGGDYAGDAGVTTPGAERDKMWQIILGIRSVRTTDLVTGHTARSGNTGATTDGDAYVAWSTYTGFNLPNIYGKSDATDTYSLAATAYARGLPFFMIEGPYENDASNNTSEFMRKAMWQAMLSGSCGALGGNWPRWAVGATAADGAGVADCITNHLNTQGDTDCSSMVALLSSYNWSGLVPKTDTSLITTSLGSAASRICGALIGSSAALIYTPAGGFTVAMTVFAQGSVRARWFDPMDGSFANVSGQPFANTGTHAFTTTGNNSGGRTDWVLVLD